MPMLLGCSLGATAGLAMRLVGTTMRWVWSAKKPVSSVRPAGSLAWSRDMAALPPTSPDLDQCVLDPRGPVDESRDRTLRFVPVFLQ
jgi:hypothetical protein